jgi:hypothetical protein
MDAVEAKAAMAMAMPRKSARSLGKTFSLLML